MLTVTKTVRFDAAHILTNHQGMCRNLHGHTYRVDVSVRRTPASAGAGVPSDMVIDFKDLKNISEEVICDVFDHSFIYNTESEGEREIAGVLEKHGMRVAPLPFRSTAENLARHFYERLLPRVPGLASVRVWETADSCAEFRT